MTCKNPDCQNKDCPCKKDQSTKAFEAFVEENPSRPEAKIYEV